jgi:hypothetical protein
MLSVTLTSTFHSLSVPESQFSKTWRRKVILWGKGNSVLLYSGIDEIRVSHLTEMEKSRKVKLIRKAILQICKAAENDFLLLLWWCPFKIQKENGRASSLPAQTIWAYYWPLLEFAGQYL